MSIENTPAVVSSQQFPVLFTAPVVSVVARRVREASTGGSTFEMSCQVSGQNLRNPGYSVLIRYEDPRAGKARKIISLSADSVLQLEDGMVPSRADSVALEKTGPLEYRFRLYDAQVSDRGLYYCDVTAWTRDPRNEWNKAVSAESNKLEIVFADTGIIHIHMLFNTLHLSFHQHSHRFRLYLWTLCFQNMFSVSEWVSLYPRTFPST